MIRTRLRLLGFVSIILCPVWASLQTTASDANKEEAAKVEKQVLRHAVFFSFKDEASKADIEKIVDAFAALPERIDSIIGFEHGVNVASNERSGGLTHCFLLSFADEAGRSAYLPHPEHKAFGNVLRPHVKDVFVIDYWGTQEPKKSASKQLKMAVFVKFKPDAEPEQIKSLEKTVSEKLAKIESIRHLEWGVNNSPEAHDKGFTHAGILTFVDSDAREKTMADPVQQEIAKSLQELAENVRILEFWTQ
ncbi:Stress responsive A/B Barrel Domain protein [Novipirellula aureliae]|uniref:Stress responsive A/B Barrel Domain protein n=1 Tax=Novipirellula aureliae TaxID=2527966 RepID=A0A5C6E3C1_9BACT|nr:Dabb family protein [Novipirellula aureliae]TWU41669.1 Stress responsive A/B Barrel Domain protein [Novipirellula aureliae]